MSQNSSFTTLKCSLKDVAKIENCYGRGRHHLYLFPPKCARTKEAVLFGSTKPKRTEIAEIETQTKTRYGFEDLSRLPYAENNQFLSFFLFFFRLNLFPSLKTKFDRRSFVAVKRITSVMCKSEKVSQE